MLRFAATLAGIVAVVWLLSVLAAPELPVVEGRDITPPDAFVAKAPLASAAHAEAPPAKEKAPEKHAEKEKQKGKKSGHKGRR